MFLKNGIRPFGSIFGVIAGLILAMLEELGEYNRWKFTRQLNYYGEHIILATKDWQAFYLCSGDENNAAWELGHDDEIRPSHLAPPEIVAYFQDEIERCRQKYIAARGSNTSPYVPNI